MRPEPEDTPGRDPEDDDLVARARAAVAEMRRQAASGGLDAQPEPEAPAEEDAPDDGDLPAPKPRRKKKGAAGRAA